MDTERKAVITDILSAIKDYGIEQEVLQILFENQMKKIKRLELDCIRQEATIGYIKAINQGRNKDIDVLCEPEPEAEKLRRYRILGV
jgi:hypothetical protein